MTSRLRLAVMATLGIVAGLACGLLGAWPFAPLVAWDVAAGFFGAWIWLTAIGPMGTAATSRHATRDDPGDAMSDLIVLTAAVASLIAVGYVLIRATTAKGGAQAALAGLGVASIALSWFVVHTLFTLRYAKLYYSGNGSGIDFNQRAEPKYLDFAYLAFTIGMTFQVSDTDLQTPAIRATALRHALLSYLFGAVILAATINLIASLGSSGGN